MQVNLSPEIKPRSILAAILFVCWLALLVLAFYRFFFANLSAFEQWATFNGTEIANLVRGQPNTMVHWQGEHCLCNKYSDEHIQDLTHLYQEYRHLRVNSEQEISNSEELIALSQFVPATPAVMVFDQRGQLAYFGPYSGGVVCGSGEDFVANTVSALAKGVNPGWINQESVGCLCPRLSQPQVALLL